MYPALVTNVSWVDNLVQLIVSILIFLFVLFLAYLTARLTGTYQSNMLRNRTNIKVIETFRIANNKYIQIAKIADKYVALGIGKDEITFLTELDADSVLDVASMPMEKTDFKEILTKIRKNKDEEDTFPKDNQ